MADETMEDLRYELKFLTQKYAILERNYNILMEERAIQEQLVDNIDLYQDEVSSKNAELAQCHKTISHLKNKLKLVLQSMALQKKALTDIRTEVTQGLRDVQNYASSNCRQVLNRHMLVAKGFNVSMDDARERLAAAMVENEELNSQLSTQTMVLNQLKSSAAAADRDFDRERGQMQTRFADLSIKIGELQKVHNETVRSLTDSLSKRNREYDDLMAAQTAMRRDHEDKMLAIKMTYEQDQSKRNREYDDLMAAHTAMRCDHEAKMQALKVKYEQDQSNLLEGKLAEMSQECIRFRGELEEQQKLNIGLKSDFENANNNMRQVQDQYNRSMQLMATLQEDLDLARRQEAALRSELQGLGGEKGEMARKLRSIQERVTEIETSHSAEMEKLLDKLNKIEYEALCNKNEAKMWQVKHDDMIAKCKTIEGQVGSKEAEKAALESRIASLESSIAAKENSIEALTTKIAQNDHDCSMLRSDKEQLEEVITRLRGEITSLLQQLQQSKSTIDGQAEKQKIAMKDLETEAKNSKLALKNALDQHFLDISAKDTEIEQLKDTIRRECEERTMMLITMSEMKDKLLAQRQQQASATTGVGTRDRTAENATAGLSQAFLNSLATPVNVGSTSTRTTSKDAGAVGSEIPMFPAIGNGGGSQVGRSLAMRSQDDDDGRDDDNAASSAHAAWARNQAKANKKSKKSSSFSSGAATSSR